MAPIAETLQSDPELDNYSTNAPSSSTSDTWNWVLALTVLLVSVLFGMLCVCLRSRLRKHLARVKEQEEAKKAAKLAGRSDFLR